jgi:hypothetical protein
MAAGSRGDVIAGCSPPSPHLTNRRAIKRFLAAPSGQPVLADYPRYETLAHQTTNSVASFFGTAAFCSFT